MPSEMPSPARDPVARGRGRGGRGGRGRGRGGGRGASSAAASAVATSGLGKPSATGRGGRGGARRGRAKNFSDSRVQAAYERQRDLKATYQAVAHALKPALQELAERNIDVLIRSRDSHTHSSEHGGVAAELQRRLDKKVAQFDNRLALDLAYAESNFAAQNYVVQNEFENGFNDLEMDYLQAQETRLRTLSALHSKDLPIDVRDDQYVYKVITDDHFDKEFGIYQDHVNGHLVPYPSRVEGTDTWIKARSGAGTGTASGSGSGTGTRGGRGRGRGSNKRKPQDQPDGAPTPKRSARGLDDSSLLSGRPAAPAPAKGLLASAAEVDLPAEEDGTAVDDEDDSTPEPPNFGVSFASRGRESGKISAREKSPPPPRTASDPDDYGVRSYVQRLAKNQGVNHRLLAPAAIRFEDWEIGYRDTSNDSSKGHTRAKRGKYLDKPNSNGMHYDHWCNGYDFSSTTQSEFDKELVKRHGLHPSYGLFMPDSVNEDGETVPYVMPGKPVVFIANPSGRVAHASRSFQKMVNNRTCQERPRRLKMGASLRRFCKMEEIDAEDISIDEYLPTQEELEQRSLGTAARELESQPSIEEDEPVEDEPSAAEVEALAKRAEEEARAVMDTLAQASAMLEAQSTPKPARPTPKPARYDAIRDLFAPSAPEAPAAPTVPAEPPSVALNILAELCFGNAQPVPPPLPEVPNGFLQAPSTHPDFYGPPVAQPEVEQSRMASFAQYSPESRISHLEAPHPYMAHPHSQPQPSPPQPPPPLPPPAHQPPPSNAPAPYSHRESVSYTPNHDPYAAPPRPSPRPYQPTVAPPPHEHLMYPQAGHYAEPQENHHGGHLARPMESSYGRRTSGYAPEPPTYHQPYWSQHMSPQVSHGPPGPLAPPGPPHLAPPAPPPPPPAMSQPYPTMQPHSRSSFGQPSSAEPLPPLRPPRGRHSSVPEDMDPSMRQSPSGHMGSFYSYGPSRPSYRPYQGSEPLAPLQMMGTDRMLPNPQQPVPSYMTSPHQAYTSHMLSPTFAHTQATAPHNMQSPPGTPLGMQQHHHQHRAGSVASADPGNKYRKLQPAPVPAHRAWTNKPELKTIPYDHKDGGSAAQLPMTGPTQIRGWAVNQPRKRGRSDKHDRADSVLDRDDPR